MGGAGEFKTAADHGAVQDRHDRHLAELDLLEHAMPAARMFDGLGEVALGQFVQVEAGGKMIALAVQHDGFHLRRQFLEEELEAGDGVVVERVALLRARQAQNRHLAVQLRMQRSGQIGRQVLVARDIHCGIPLPLVRPQAAGRYRYIV